MSNRRPGYQHSDVGLIPADWEVRKLGDGIVLQSGQHVLAQYCNNSEGTPYLTGPSDFGSGRIDCTKFTTRPTSICKRNDILITVKGSGVGAMTLADDEYCISRQLMAIRPIAWEAGYVFRFLGQKSSAVAAASTGLIPGLSRDDILKQAMPVPSRVEQTCIASALDHADELIAALEALIAKKRDLKQGAMQELLTGQRRLPGFGPQRLPSERTDAEPFPEDWRVAPLGAFMEFQNGFNADRAAYGTGVPFVNVLEVITKSHLSAADVPGRVAVSGAQLRNFEVRHGDVLFNRTSETQEEIALASVYRGEEPVIFGGFVIRGRPDTAQLESKYAGYGLRAPFVRAQLVARGQGAIRANVGQGDLRKVLVPLPNCDEQRAIAAVLSDMDAEIAALDAKLSKARDVKQGMMQALLTGEVRLV